MKQARFLLTGWMIALFYGMAISQQIDYHAKAKALVNQMTLKEKASLCSGEGTWRTKAVPRVGLPSIYMTDGPYGLRKQLGEDWGKNVPATCFPTLSALAASWNVELLKEVGYALSEECQENDVNILLGPGINIKRSPLCGRNFEYFSEDPVLAGKLAAAYINGLQSGGVGPALKHFAANNQETDRLTSSSNIDERTLHEIYLRGFEIAVKEANPWSIMSCYNQINHQYGSENYYLLHDVLRAKWGFNNFVMTDWGAVHDRVKGVMAGCNLEMPSTWGYFDSLVVVAVQKGELREGILDTLATDLVSVVLRLTDLHKQHFTFNRQTHFQLAQKAASEGVVLLKNKNNILPLANAKTKISVIGFYAKTPRFQGAGSAALTPLQVTNVFDELQKKVGSANKLAYAAGYDEKFNTNSKLLAEAEYTARQSQVSIICVALPDTCDSEGHDRQSLGLPEAENKLIEAIVKVQPNVVVISMNGSAIAMPWLNKVKGVIEGMLSGEAGGAALADILTGTVNPSGKLAETFPVRIEDTPSFPDYPGLNNEVNYGEGVFVGYRYYDKKKIEPLFPFGYGLSYTSFMYSNLKINKQKIIDTDTVIVTVDVTNTGKVAGKEVVQLYVQDNGLLVNRAEEELKHFEKILLQPNETKTVSFRLSYRDFSYYNVKQHNWYVESGRFNIMAGNSSRNLPLTGTIDVASSAASKK